MALFDTVRNWWNGMMTTLNTPLFTDNAPPELRPILGLTEAEIARQKEVIVARMYHEGRHQVHLTDRLIQFVGESCRFDSVRLNMVQKINAAPARRLIIESWDSDAEDGEEGPQPRDPTEVREKPEDTEKSRQIDFATRVWRKSRMKAKRSAMHVATMRDGQHFIIIDWDEGNGVPRFTPHQSYTDISVSVDGEKGDGEGVWMKYPNDDPDQPPLYAVKRWTEIVNVDKSFNAGKTAPEPRLTVYYPERIAKYKSVNNQWQFIEEVPWVDGNGEPLGIPVVHLKTPTMLPIAREAIPIQKALNKIFIDMLAASDFEAWALFKAFGFDPDVNDVQPGGVVGDAAKTPDQASFEKIEGTGAEHQIELIDKNIALMADVSNVPLSLVQRSAQRAAEGTLQEEKEDFIAFIRDIADTLEIAYEDAMKIARRLHNVFGDLTTTPNYTELDEAAEYIARWQDFWSRTVAERAEEVTARKESGYTDEEIQRKVWKEDESTIEQMRLDKVGGDLGSDSEFERTPSLNGQNAAVTTEAAGQAAARER